MSDEDVVVATQGLTRDFKHTRAVDGLDLEIRRGELFGLVGPDGAGKTTTLRLLAGLLTITAGSATVVGHDLAREAEAAKPLIGYMAQRFSLYGELSVVENLTFFAELYDVPHAERVARTERLLAFAGLTPFRGTARRLPLRRDEEEAGPGLHADPRAAPAPARRADHRRRPRLAPRVLGDPDRAVYQRDDGDRQHALYGRGRPLLSRGLDVRGTADPLRPPEVIRQDIGGDLIEVQAEDWQAARTLLGGAPGVRELQTYGASLHLIVDDAARRLPEIRARLAEAGLETQGLRLARPRMEEAFISLVRGLETEEEA